MTVYKEIYNEIPDNFKKIYNEDGTIDIPVIWLSNNPDKEDEIVDIKTFIIPDTVIVGYNHNRCNGAKVATGAKVLRETITRTENLLTSYVRVAKSDEMFFCDRGSSQKKTNGKVLEAIEKNHLAGTSLGFRIDRDNVEVVFLRKKRITVYYYCIAQELSLLDIAPMSYDTRIINKSIINLNMPNDEKQKCINCLREAGVGTVVVNPENKFAIITEITDTEIKAKSFDGTEMTLDETFEEVNYSMLSKEVDNSVEDTEKEKACACMKKALAKPDVKELEKAVDGAMPSMSEELVTQLTTLRTTVEENRQFLNERVDRLKTEILETVNQKLDIYSQEIEKNKSINSEKVTLQEVDQKIQDAINVERANKFAQSKPKSEAFKTYSAHPYL